ncbi:2145_t:CDS:1, partial [Cetraspora pellucida]
VILTQIETHTPQIILSSTKITLSEYQTQIIPSSTRVILTQIETHTPQITLSSTKITLSESQTQIIPSSTRVILTQIDTHTSQIVLSSTIAVLTQFETQTNSIQFTSLGCLCTGTLGSIETTAIKKPRCCNIL